MTDVIWGNGEFSPTQIGEISEAFEGDLDKAKGVYRDFTDGCASGMDLGDLTQIGREIARGITYDTDFLFTAIPFVWDRFAYHPRRVEFHKTKGGREIKFHGSQGDEADHYVIVRDVDSEVFIEARRYDDPVSFADLATCFAYDEGDANGRDCVKQVVGRPASDRYPETLEYCVEELSDKHDKEQVEAWVKEFGVKRIAVIASGHAQVKEGVKNKDPYFETLYEMDLTPVSALVEAFERQFSQDEAEAVVAGFGGDVRRASQLYRELTHDYAGSMTVEGIIKAGKDGHYD